MAEAAGIKMTNLKVAEHRQPSSKAHLSRTPGMRGFSLTEMAIVVGLILTLSAASVISLGPAMQSARTANAFNTVLTQMRDARQRAIQKREQYIVCFGAAATPAGALTPLGLPTAQSIQVYEWPANTALSSAVQINRVELPFDIQFQTLGTFPIITPDNYGLGPPPINFDQIPAGSVPDQVVFQPDGSAHDWQGNLNNGIVYMARNNDPLSGRAITLFGASGATHGWRLVLQGAAYTWVRQ
jgi:type II secretory pathway pseudopilin PulG